MSSPPEVHEKTPRWVVQAARESPLVAGALREAGGSKPGYHGHWVSLGCTACEDLEDRLGRRAGSGVTGERGHVSAGPAGSYRMAVLHLFV